MASFEYDIIFVGGGLTNSLLAWQLKQVKPWVRFVLLEKGNVLGGKHTWSFHESDVSKEALDWLHPVISASWPFYQVIFPQYIRKLESGYYSIRSKKLNNVLISDLCENVQFEKNVEILSLQEVLVNGVDRLSASIVVDGRGVSVDSLEPCAFQKFVGLEIELSHPHGLKGPILMDATVKQEDGYRFFYCLPWNETRLLVEDTRYSEKRDLNNQSFRKEILDYCLRRNWQVKEVFDEEVGCLPLPYRVPKLSSVGLSVGMRAGLFHPTTGYSLPFAVRTVERFLKVSTEAHWVSAMRNLVDDSRKNQKVFVWLNRVMFGALRPESRYKFLEHFYQLPQNIIDLFYSHRMKTLDWVRFFCRLPPVRISSAFKALLSERVHEI